MPTTRLADARATRQDTTHADHTSGTASGYRANHSTPPGHQAQHCHADELAQLLTSGEGMQGPSPLQGILLVEAIHQLCRAAVMLDNGESIYCHYADYSYIYMLAEDKYILVLAEEDCPYTVVTFDSFASVAAHLLSLDCTGICDTVVMGFQELVNLYRDMCGW